MCISRRVGQIFIENALNNIEIKIDGEEKLDFTYIKDLIQWVKKIILTNKSKNQFFNLTFGSSKKINDMLEILKANFENLKVKYQPTWSLDKGYPKYIEWYKEIYKFYNEKNK